MSATGGSADPLGDDALQARLRALLSLADPVPSDATLAARSALAHRDLDAQLAELLDSEKSLAGVRSVGAAETLSFASEDLSIDVEVERRGDGLWLRGQVLGDTPSRLTLHQPGSETVDLAVDDMGRFEGAARPGPMRLEAVTASRRPILTSWVTL